MVLTPVFRLTAVIAAAGVAAPVASSTLPDTTASVPCDHATDANRTAIESSVLKIVSFP